MTVSIYKNSGGTFTGTDIGTADGVPKDIQILDYNSDGALDVVVSTANGHLDAFKNVTTSFAKVDLGSSITPVSFNRFDAADLDMDGDMDFAIGDAGGDVRFFNQTAPDTYTKSILGNVLSPVGGLDIADMDGDGDPDIVAGCDNDKISVLKYNRLGFLSPSQVANGDIRDTRALRHRHELRRQGRHSYRGLCGGDNHTYKPWHLVRQQDILKDIPRHKLTYASGT